MKIRSFFAAGLTLHLCSAVPSPSGGQPSDHKYRVVEFSRSQSAEDHARLRKQGIALLDYIGDGAYVASVTESGIQSILRDGSGPPTRALLPCEKEGAGPRVAEGPLIEACLELQRDLDRDEVAAFRKKLDARQVGPRALVVRLERASLEELSESAAVRRIGPGRFPPFLFANRSRDRTRGDAAKRPLYHPDPSRVGYDLDGEGIEIGICDSGIDANHVDFFEVDGSDGSLGSHSRVDPQRISTNPKHGTQVASIAAGSGYGGLAAQYPAYAFAGFAPAAGLGDYPRYRADLAATYKALVEDGMDLTNHSYAQSPFYDCEAGGLDAIVRGDAVFGDDPIPAKVQVWSAGNNGVNSEDPEWGNTVGYYSVFTSAKNTISVGAVDATGGYVSWFSSLGPTLDGRIKPDVVAPGRRNRGTDRFATARAGTSDYDRKAHGTSMAAPAVSGIIALLMQHHAKCCLDSGKACLNADCCGGSQANSLCTERPPAYPSTYKAVLIHSARDVVKPMPFELATLSDLSNPDTGSKTLYHTGPDFASGWGEVDADAARVLMTAPNRWNEDEISQTGDLDTWCMDVPEGAGQIRATIAWDDLPGEPTCDPSKKILVNDLDLAVIDGAGTVHGPWVLAPIPASANGTSVQANQVLPAERQGVDRLNNVEVVDAVLPNSGHFAGGKWKVVVSGHDLPMAQEQKYSLVTTYGATPCED